MSYQISTAQATQLAEIALRSIDQELPYSAQHVHRSAHDRRLPRELHPAFYGCFDWHSAVHSHWMLVRLLRSMPQLALAGSIRAALATHLSGENLQVEAAYFHEPGRNNYERPYGWAWLLKLAEELSTWDAPDAQRWSQALHPLVEVIVAGTLASAAPRSWASVTRCVPTARIAKVSVTASAGRAKSLERRRVVIGAPWIWAMVA
jgi:hypothetical protein